MDTTTRREVRSEELRRNLRPLLNSVEREQAHVTIKRYDEDTAVIVPVGWYQIALVICEGVRAITHGSDGKRLPDETTLTVGDLHSAIGEAASSELEN
jgi:hypothetical protein